MRLFPGCVRCVIGAVAAWVCAVLLVGSARAQNTSTSSPPAQARGDAFLAEVLATLQRRPNVAARLRYRARLEDETLTGSGRYWQRGTGSSRVTRWEMQTQVAGKTASYVQVFDGDHLWTDRTLPGGRRVNRLDTSRLQSRLRTAAFASLNNGPKPTWQSLVEETEGQGGLAQLLADSLRRFTFAPPQPVQLNGLSVYALLGRWRGEELQKLWPEFGTPDEPTSWPTRLPHHTLILVGKSNLFPYVVEHRRQADSAEQPGVVSDRPTTDPLMRCELFEVQFAAEMDDSLFEFKPGDIQWSDETSLVLERLKEQAQATNAL